jgi:hypothetical protein
MSAGTQSASVKEPHSLREAPAVVPRVPVASAGEERNAASPPVYAGDMWGLRIWLAGAGILVFLHITEMLGRIFR